MNRKQFIQQCLANAFPDMMREDKGNNPYSRYKRGAIALWERMGEDGLGDAAKTPMVASESVYASLPDKPLFDRFWKAYGLTKDREGAARSWMKIKDREKLAEIIIAAAQKAKEEALNTEGTRKYAQGWLSDRRWEDYDIPTAKAEAKTNERQRAINKLNGDLKGLMDMKAQAPYDGIDGDIARIRAELDELRRA